MIFWNPAALLPPLADSLFVGPQIPSQLCGAGPKLDDIAVSFHTHDYRDSLSLCQLPICPALYGRYRTMKFDLIRRTIQR